MINTNFLLFAGVILTFKKTGKGVCWLLFFLFTLYKKNFPTALCGLISLDDLIE